jgi:hypothetical protein
VNQILEVDVIDVETKVTRRARMDLKGGLTKDGLREAMENIARLRKSHKEPPSGPNGLDDPEP